MTTGGERTVGQGLRPWLAPLLLALALVAGALGLARFWTFDAGAGPELQASFELGPLGPDRTASQTLRSDTDDLIGVQLLARALGTIEPVSLRADLFAGDVPVATTEVQVFQSRSLQALRVLFPLRTGPGMLRLELGMNSRQAGAVIFGATRGDSYLAGALALDGQPVFADQDLALRPVYRRTAWRALGLLAMDGPAGPLVAGVAVTAAALPCV